MTLTLRPATLQDLPTLIAVEGRFHPDEPVDPVGKRHHWKADDPDRVSERWLAESGGEVVGYLVSFHRRWETVNERRAWAMCGYLPGIDPRQILEFAAETAVAGGVQHLVIVAREDDIATLGALADAGYRRDALEKSWELDLDANRNRLLELTAASRVAMDDQGVVLQTVDKDPHPEVMRRLYEAWIDARRDVPRSHEVPATPYNGWMVWMTAPDVRPDRIWIAKEGDQIIGMSHLRYPPVRGNVWTAFTGTIRAARGRGVGRAVKMETLAQAIELGIPRVRTGNDERNAPMLHINEDLGYRRIPGFLTYEKALGSSQTPNQA